MADSNWQYCFEKLRTTMDQQEFDLLVRPLQVRVDTNRLELVAPNRYVVDALQQRYRGMFEQLLAEAAARDGSDHEHPVLRIEVGTIDEPLEVELESDSEAAPNTSRGPLKPVRADGSGNFDIPVSNRLQKDFTFDNFIEGRSNELARAAARQVSENAGTTYNPLLIYGGVGLGKTHLMHAVGHTVQQSDRQARVLYVHSQRFVQDMVDALRKGTMSQFTAYYRSPQALLIDDVQFFANKFQSQDEFFNIFNSLLERGQQIVLTCDRYPREVEGLEERLQSRFVWGLTVEVDLPELETRVAILRKKAETEGVDLDTNAAFYIAERLRSNVRELEGALRRVMMHSRFTGKPITVESTQHALRDLFAVQARLVTIERIQRIVAEYYNIKVTDILSKRRNRAVVRPRQMSMSLAKELTAHSLPEIGDAFGGKDHTTVIHACRKIAELKASDPDIMEDYRNLSRMLNS